MEIWKDLIGFEKLYKISSIGRVKSLGNGKSTNPMYKESKIIKTGISTRGYEKIKLFKDGKRYYFNVHRLVADTFLFEKEGKKEVNHKDGNKLNNSVDNLEWVSASENQKHAYRIGLQIAKKGSENYQSKPIKQLTLDGELIRIFGSINEVTRELGFNTFGIIKCCKKEKKYKTAYKFKWEYVY
jgi:hypothetical protein